jgi:hypothetical protein
MTAKVIASLFRRRTSRRFTAPGSPRPTRAPPAR